MRARLASHAIACAFAAVFLAPVAVAEADRSAAIKQVTRGATLAERSSAGFDQISTVAAGRTSAVDQIDPSLEAKSVPEASGDKLTDGQAAASAGPCVLTPEQQAIVTSLQSQGRLPAGDCEMVAWFGRPGDEPDAEDRRSLAEAVVTTSPELLGQESEAARIARLEAERQQAEAAASAAIAATILTPTLPGPPGK